jgi:4-diphosphocytidyl-2-C-methyl-D-erythritol kinase
MNKNNTISNNSIPTNSVSTNSFAIKSFAKVNLGLQVLNKRPDGFHNINTIFSRINLFDEIEITPNNTNEISLIVKNNDELNTPENLKDNLIVKAFFKIQNKIIKSKSDLKIGIDVKLTKNIPIGAGLGGGSSNAATIITQLQKIFNLKLSDGELQIIAQSIGSDVPYFLKDGMAVAKSRGEKLKYFTHNLGYKLFLINPKIHISTPWAYGVLNREVFESINQKQNIYEEINFYQILIQSKNNDTLLRSYLINDFEKAIFGKYPEIQNIKKNLYDMGAVFSLMSGSGSTVFGLFKDNSEFENIKKYYQTQYSNYFIFHD